MPPPPPLSTPTQPSLTSALAKPKTKGKIHVSFTDWVLGGSLLSINSPTPNNVVPAATRQRNDSRIRATATKDKNGRNIVILEDREQDGMMGEVEMLVVRKVSKKNGHGRGRSGSAGEVVSVKAKISEEVLETVVEESKEEKKAESKEEVKDEKKEEKQEEVVEVKKADGDDKGEQVLNLQKDGGGKEEAVKVVEEKSEESKPKGEEPKADVVIEIAAVPSTEDKEKDKKAEPKVIVVEVEVKEKEDKDKGKDKKKDKDVKETSKDSKEKTSSITDKAAEKAVEEPIETTDDKKDEKIELVDGNEWNKEQDSKLMAMKKENKTWKEISGELGTGKKEVVARYKVLQEQEKAEDEEEKAEVEEKPTKVEKKKKIKCTAEVDNEDTEEGIYISPDCPYHHPQSKASAASAPKQEKKKKRKSYGELEKDRDDEDEEQEERMQGNGHGTPQGHLRPDKIWSVEDCETLEYLMEKHRSTQWLQLQAGFFNYTGRMVKAEFIERKFRKDGLA